MLIVPPDSVDAVQLKFTCVLLTTLAVKLLGGVGRVTVKTMELLAWPPTVTTTFPVVAPAGTGTTMLLSPQLIGVAVAPLNITVLTPCVTPKLVPEIVTEVVGGPDVGLKLVIAGLTWKATALLPKPLTITCTPSEPTGKLGTITTKLELLQLVGATPIPPKVTVLAPWDAPKFEPVTVTELNAGPDAGFRPEMLGVTVKLTPLVAEPPTFTTRGPVVAPVGTGTRMLVALQLVGVAGTPLKLTVLVP